MLTALDERQFDKAGLFGAFSITSLQGDIAQIHSLDYYFLDFFDLESGSVSDWNNYSITIVYKSSPANTQLGDYLMRLRKDKRNLF